jgi:transcriptional regulator with XRE-family HTH domain
MTRTEFKKLRKSGGYSQLRLAKEMGLFIRTISRYETGELKIPKVTELALRYIVQQSKRK